MRISHIPPMGHHRLAPCMWGAEGGKCFSPSASSRTSSRCSSGSIPPIRLRLRVLREAKRGATPPTTPVANNVPVLFWERPRDLTRWEWCERAATAWRGLEK